MLKTRIRRALLDRLYQNKDCTPGKNNENNRNTFHYLQDGEFLPLTMRAECCNLVEGLISIVVPVYNQANLVIELIESVQSQTYQNYELIIINDESSPSIKAILDRYVDHPKIRCYTQANQCLSAALSSGFNFARGEFWAWISADKIMPPGMLELLIRSLQADQLSGMVYVDCHAKDDRGDLLQELNLIEPDPDNPASGEICLSSTTAVLSKPQDNSFSYFFMYRGWIGRCLGDYDAQPDLEGYDYWLRINALFSSRHLGDANVLYHKRIQDNALRANALPINALEKMQRLVDYDNACATYFAKPLTYIADVQARRWLLIQGITEAEISVWGQESIAPAVAVIHFESLEGTLPQLLSSGQPVALILNRFDTDYHRIQQLLQSGNCIVLVEDNISAKRVRLLSSTCPVVDAKSKMAIVAVQSFVKNRMLLRTTLSQEVLNRETPQRILGLCQYHIVLQVDSFLQGGMENVVIDLALSLEGSQYTVTIVNFGQSGDAALRAREGGLNIVSLPADLPDDTYASWLRSKNVKIVNAHYSVRAAAICADMGIPFIQTIHTSYIWLHPDQIEKYREADRYTSEYICVSMTAARYADVILGLDAGKMRIVPNGIDQKAIDATSYDKNRSSLRRAWGVSANAPVFLNVASIMANKAQLPLVRAFAQVVEKIPDARLILLGSIIETDYHAQIEKVLQKHGLQKNVLFAGYDRNVSHYYHAADVFVLPSFLEGWSLSLGEALANGLPSVITNVGSAYQFEGFDGVEIVECPFGDINRVNYRNYWDIVLKDHGTFVNRLADSMIRATRNPRSSVNSILASQLDRNIAYKSYAEIFANYTRG